MNEEMINQLRVLADKYETEDFIKKDPSQFMHNYSDVINQEIAAFVAANLAFGRRDQILLHVNQILQEAGYSPYDWIMKESYTKMFVLGDKSFYRMYTHNSMLSFFDTIKNMLNTSGSIGEHLHKRWIDSCNSEYDLVKGYTNKPLLCHVISREFSSDCNLIPHTVESSSKKLNMLIRWMVRDSSPVDLGLWTWYDKKDLLIPLDTHVMQEATRFELIAKTKTGKIQGATIKTAIALTDVLREAFQDDPVRGDFALFGLGVDKV